MLDQSCSRTQEKLFSSRAWRRWLHTLALSLESEFRCVLLTPLCCKVLIFIPAAFSCSPAPPSLWWGAASQKREPDVRERGAAFIRIRTRMRVFQPYRCRITGHFMLNLALSGIDFACMLLRVGEVIKHKLELNLFWIKLCVFLNSSDTEIN